MIQPQQGSTRYREPSARHSAPIFAMALLTLHGLWYFRALAWDAVDDAYISFRYARNLIQGKGLVFNVGERVEGYTNFLWTVLLAPFIGLGIPPAPLAAVGGLALSGVTLWLVYRLGGRIGGSWVGAIAALLLAVDGSFALWSVGGMETAMFACLAIAGALAYLNEQSDSRRLPTSGLFFALAAMVRPEGVLLMAVTAGHQALARLRREGRLMDRRDATRVLLFVGLWGTYFLGRWRYYGFPLPNTFYVKVEPAGTAAQINRGLRYLHTFTRIHLGYIAWIPLAMLLLRRRVDFWTTYAGMIVGTYSAYVIYVGGDWSVGRFFVPLLPFLYLLMAQGMERAYRTLEHSLTLPSDWQRRICLAMLSLLLLGMGLASSLWGEYALFVRSFEAGLANRARITMGRWLRDNVPSDTVIAVDAAGELPFYSQLHTIDLFGITQPAIAHMEVPTMGEGTPGHEKFGLGHVLNQAPDYIIIYGNSLDGVESYQRVEVDWTEDQQLRAFLSVYRRKARDL